MEKILTDAVKQVSDHFKFCFNSTFLTDTVSVIPVVASSLVPFTLTARM